MGHSNGRSGRWGDRCQALRIFVTDEELDVRRCILPGLDLRARRRGRRSRRGRYAAAPSPTAQASQSQAEPLDAPHQASI